jgi:ERCC4-related helicase
MADLVGGLRQAIQDLVAPDLKAIQAKQDSMSEQMEVQHDALLKTVEAFRAEMRSEFAALRTNNQLEVLRQVSPLSERISVVESSGGRKFRKE